MFQFIFQISLVFFLNSCLQTQEVTEIEHQLSGDRKIGVTIQRVENTNVRYINLTAKYDDKVIELQNPIYYEKDWDGDISPNFEKIFRYRYWVNDQTFFVGANDNTGKTNKFLLITNRSTKTADQVVVNANGQFIIYNLLPNQEIKLPIDWIKEPEILSCKAWIDVVFDDKTKILLGSNEFVFSNQNDKSLLCGSGEISFDGKRVSFLPL